VLRGILAVIAGYIVLVGIVDAANYALQAVEPGWFLAGAPPTQAYLAVNIAYSFVAALIAGYVTALVAKQPKLQSVYVLAAVSLAMAILSALTADADQPRWYQIVRALLMPAAVIAAGWLRERAMRSQNRVVAAQR
jgi:hypothetical protein